jgi:Spy/CpxP family protein refolding chaperone
MKAARKLVLTIAVVVILAMVAGAQSGPASGPGRSSQGAAAPCAPMGPGMAMGSGMGRGPGMGMRAGMGMGKWWNNSALAKSLGLTDAQARQIEGIFQRHRTQLMDLMFELNKQEATLEPLIDAEQVNEKQVTAQIDRVAQARANLERSNAQMLLAIRRALTLAQWKQLRSQGVSPLPGPMAGGPAGW